MEIQWSLVLFTALSGAGAWLVACAGLDAFKGLAKKTVVPAVVTGIVLIIVGGIASATHLLPRRSHHGRAGAPGSGHFPGGRAPRHRRRGCRRVPRAVSARRLRRGAQGPRCRRRGHGRRLQLCVRFLLHDVLAAGLEHCCAALGLPGHGARCGHGPVVPPVRRPSGKRALPCPSRPPRRSSARPRRW